jgi:hypothetical protein
MDFTVTPQSKKQEGMHSQGYSKADELVPFAMAAGRLGRVPALDLKKARVLCARHCRSGYHPTHVAFCIC